MDWTDYVTQKIALKLTFFSSGNSVEMYEIKKGGFNLFIGEESLSYSNMTSRHS